MKGIGVLGAGAWGTALAFQLARVNKSLPIYLWGFDPAQQKQLQADGFNKAAFPDYKFPDNLHPVVELAEVVANVLGVVIVVPSHGFTALVENLFKNYQFSLPILSATKGLEPNTAELLYTVIEKLAGKNYPFSALSGPSFANEVIAALPTAITLASTQTAQLNFWKPYLNSDYFRVYTTDDVIGVQLGGAVKNVLAIAVGIADGLGFGANARSALITRGLAEMMRLNTQLGGKKETLMGLAGLGDLVLTCTDNQSRNRRFGKALGSGKTIAQAQEELQQVVEGYQTAKLLHQLMQHHHIDMPICTSIYQVLYEKLPVTEVIHELLARTTANEF